jgi:hypothetical protein
MPDQDKHERLEDQVEPAHLPVRPAETLEEGANSNNSLEGYAAINNLNETEFGEEAVKLEEEQEKARAAKKGRS